MILNPNRPASGAPDTAGIIKESDTRTFNEDVVLASMNVPVIVDFWAPWCGPCKQLGSTLEKLVRQAGGLVRLVKINIDNNQNLAAQLRIQSVPTVYAFVGGRPVDAFTGAQPESKLRAFIDRLTGGAQGSIDRPLEQAEQALAGGNPKAAVSLYSRILAQDPTNPKAIAGLVRSRVAAGDAAGARRAIEDLPADLKAHPEIATARAAVELAEQTRKTGNIDALRKRVAVDPNDHQSRFDLTMALYGGGRAESAVDELLGLVRTARDWNDDAARKQLVRIFDALGPKHPLTVAARRRLSSILFS